MSLNKDMAEFFDGLAAKWNNNPSEYGTREKLTSMMNLSPNSIIADIGCGKGVMFEHLLKTNPSKIIGVDISGEMLRSAMTLYYDDRIEYVNDDFITAQLPMVDAAVIFNAYPHFLDKGALVEKLARTIKRNGMIFIAHSRGKSKINGVHKGVGASALSIPLKNAEAEARRFQQYFTPDVIIDNEDLYLIKMTRNREPFFH